MAQGRRVNLTGQRFGNLTVLQPVRGPRQAQMGWLCRCSCGVRVVKRMDNLLSGVTKSCGYAHRWAWREHREEA